MLQNQQNQRNLHEEAIFDVIKMFYPEFNDLLVTKKLARENKVHQQQTNKFLLQCSRIFSSNRLTQVAAQKLCMSNTIYELSGIQFDIQQLLPKDELIQSRDKNLEIYIKTLQTSINSPIFRKDVSNELYSRIKINLSLQDDEQEQGSQQIVSGQMRQGEQK